MTRQLFRRIPALASRLLLTTACVALATAAHAASYSVISEKTSKISVLIGDLTLTDTVVQEGPHAINRFTMHRLRRAFGPRKGTLVLLPPLGNSFRGYLTSEDGDPGKSFAAFFARLGYDVYGYSPRETGIAPGQCGGALDCSQALKWSVQTVVDDVTYIRSQIRTSKKPVIGGLSLGAATSIAVVNAHPNDYSGLLAWDGSVFTANPLFQAHNQPSCTQYTGLVDAGVAVDDQSTPFVKLVAQLAQAAPNAAFAIPVPGFPPGLTNLQAFILILSTPNPAAPSPRPGFISAAGDFPSSQLFFSETARLTSNIAAFNDVTANRTSRDLYCSLAGVETAYTNNLAAFRKPVMIIKAGQGFGPIMDELPAKLVGSPITLWQMNNFGHVDHFGSPNHLALLELPISVWLSGVL